MLRNTILMGKQRICNKTRPYERFCILVAPKYFTKINVIKVLNNFTTYKISIYKAILDTFY